MKQQQEFNWKVILLLAQEDKVLQALLRAMDNVGEAMQALRLQDDKYTLSVATLQRQALRRLVQDRVAKLVYA